MRELRCQAYKPLTEEQIRDIDAAVVQVLEDVGVMMEHRPALEVMADHGCRVDFGKRIVRVPESILRKALSTAPARFTLHGLKPEFDVPVDLDRIYTIGGSSALFVIGLDGVRRPATMQDLHDLTRLQDALPSLDIMHGIVNPQDIPQVGFDRRLFSAVLSNTARNYYSQAIGAGGVRDQVEMASLLLGGREAVRRRCPFTIVLCLISPLTHSAIRLEELMECARQDVPIYVEVDSQPGATTPVTLAGTLVEECATVLAGIVLAQLLKPGLPSIFAIASGVMDMGTGNYSGGDPRTTLLHAATAQMARFYKLPFQGGTGIDATCSDAQAGYERGLQVLGNALAGTNFIHLSIGLMEQMLTASYEQCVIDDEILAASFAIARGIEVTPETLAVDVIREVGPGGNFLAHDHTLRHFRNASFFPRLTSRRKYEAWRDEGAKDMRQRANERAREILASHHPEYIDAAMKAELEKMAVALQGEAEM